MGIRNEEAKTYELGVELTEQVIKQLAAVFVRVEAVVDVGL